MSYYTSICLLAVVVACQAARLTAAEGDGQALATADKRAQRFYGWAGKRSDDGELEKRAPFYAWSGKRGVGDDLEKRSKQRFYAWSGKRAENMDEITEEKRQKQRFYAWSGKRAEEPMEMPEEKRRFYQWSG